MLPLVAIDVSDATAGELRGWGRYTSRLVQALLEQEQADIRVEAMASAGGPEVLFEQARLPLELRRKRAALVHAPNCFLPLLRPCPGVVTVHDLAFEVWPSDFPYLTRIKYKTITPRAVHSAERVICPSTFTREDLYARYRVDPTKVRVIPEAPALPSGSQQPPGGRYLLAVGDLRAKKNLFELVSAFVELREQEQIPHRLVLAGADAGSGERLRELAGGAPVELTGYVDDGRLDALIRGAELVVHPSLYEGFGLVVLEAMARGTPVLAARATSLPETGGEAAAYFEPGEQGSLRERLAALIDDESERSALARRGLERAAGFSWERTASQTVDVYRELL